MRTALLLLITMALAANTVYGHEVDRPPPSPAEEQPEVLTQGPVHEAFAEPVDLQAQQGLVTQSQPPPDVAEEPPAEQPAGRRSIWVPGYWAWDPQREGYLWVSGCWRVPPPNRYWVPGCWTRTNGGWLWVPGFWSPVGNLKEIEYLPAPPSVVDAQPPGPSPSQDNIWVPPCWYWHQGRYAWRPGYWLAAHTDWVWAPSHYVCTPRGYVFVPGHWDYTLGRRGVLFAPIYFPSPVYARPGFSLSLRVVLNLDMMQFSLFTCPRYNHFFFGDYYDEVNISFGIFPRFKCASIHTWYDPIYVHDRWRHHRIKPNWDAYQRREYDRRRVERNLRPPRTYREMEVRQARMPESQRRSIQVAEPLDRHVSDQRSPIKSEQTMTHSRQRLSTEAASVHRFGEERKRRELVSSRPQKLQSVRERRRSLVHAAGPTERESPRAGRERLAMQGVEQRGPTTQLADHRTPITASPDGRRGVPPAADRHGSVTPSLEKRGRASPGVEHRSPRAPSAERRSGSAPPREAKKTSLERARIPDSPVTDRSGARSTLRKGQPSRLAAEQGTDVRDSPRGSQAPDSMDARRNRDSSRDRR